MTVTESGDRLRHNGLVYRSPVINISRDPRWGRIDEAFGEDPFLTSRMTVAYAAESSVEGIPDGEGYRPVAPPGPEGSVPSRRIRPSGDGSLQQDLTHRHRFGSAQGTGSAHGPGIDRAAHQQEHYFIARPTRRPSPSSPAPLKPSSEARRKTSGRKLSSM